MKIFDVNLNIILPIKNIIKTKGTLLIKNNKVVEKNESPTFS
jgi:hypothetical protein